MARDWSPPAYRVVPRPGHETPEHPLLSDSDSPAWLQEFTRRTLVENELLTRNGAGDLATARRELLDSLADTWHYRLDAFSLPVHDAASELDIHPETIRRAIRAGTIRDLRAKPKQRYRVHVDDIEVLRALYVNGNGRRPAVQEQVLVE